MYQQFTKRIAKLERCCVFQEVIIRKLHTYKITEHRNSVI